MAVDERVERAQVTRSRSRYGPARRIEQVQAPVIAVVGELIRAHPGTISLGQGIVHYPPPPEAMRAVADAMAVPERHQYGHVQGMPPLLDRIRTKLIRENGFDHEERQEVLVTAGGNMAFVNAILAIADPGDEIILLSPYYFNHEMAVGIAGCRAVPVPTDASYQPRIDAIQDAITDRTRAVVTVSPNNPTGAVYSEESLRAINELCGERGLYHISDEAYEYFVYDGARHFSPGSIEGAGAYTISLFSLSKAYGMAGWRLGYMAAPEVLLPSLKKIQDTILICPPIPSQHAALGAMEAGPGYCIPYVDGLADTRRLVLTELARLGGRVSIPPARGAFYVFARVHTGDEDMHVVRRLIAEYRVAVIPGSTFGMADGCYLRIAYGALEKDAVAEAVGRLVQGLSDIIGG